MTSSISSLISPTKARRDAAQAKDWAYVSSWLTKKYHPRQVPRFERNTDTLKALLELAAVNEAADCEVELLQQAEKEELREYEEAQKGERGPCREIVDALEDGLDEGGTHALRVLAEASVLLGTLSTDPVVIGERIIELSHDKFEMEEQLRRIGDLQSQLERDMATMKSSIENIHSQIDEAAQEDILQRTAQLNRETKQFTAKIGEYNERIAGLERYKITSPSIPEVKEQEQRVKKLQARVKAFERQIADFHGLPPDLEAARGEYKRAQIELHELTRRRDELFEGMVDQ
jgi:HAUS augmin-like complex subunit 1